MKTPQEIKDHFHWMRTRLMCCVCHDDVHVEACHVRFSDYAAGKINPGMGAKDHSVVVPMCGRHHRLQHDHPNGEQGFWEEVRINPIRLGRRLWKVSGDAEAGEREIWNAKAWNAKGY